MLLRIAMWSGPRNISTALMRSFGARTDTVVCDEPLYAHFLKETGRPHPGAAEVISVHEADWRVVVEGLVNERHGNSSVFYQKHMAHHLLPGMALSWIGHLSSVFLIREPEAMLSSLLRVFPTAELGDTGLPQQVALFDSICERQGHPPPVLGAAALLGNPEGMLRTLCGRLQIDFQPQMLQWSPGPRDTDGCWARHWYSSVYQTTGFGRPVPSPIEIPSRKQGLLKRCRELYARLVPHQIQANDH